MGFETRWFRPGQELCCAFGFGFSGFFYRLAVSGFRVLGIYLFRFWGVGGAGLWGKQLESKLLQNSKATEREPLDMFNAGHESGCCPNATAEGHVQGGERKFCCDGHQLV